MFPGQDRVLQAETSSGAGHRLGFLARAFAERMIDREDGDLRRPVTVIAPARGKMQQRETVGAARDGKRNMAIRRKGRE